jgi:hypothetical protein
MFTSERTIAPRSAVPNPLRKKPGTSLLVIRRSTALITSVNSPNVRMLIGKVSITSIGFIRRDNNPQMIEITMSGCHPAMVKPGTIYEVT